MNKKLVVLSLFLGCIISPVLFPCKDANALSSTNGFCWVSTSSSSGTSRYSTSQVVYSPMSVTVDPGNNSTVSLYLHCNVRSGGSWGGMIVKTNPSTNVNWLSGVNGQNDHQRGAMQVGTPQWLGCWKTDESGGSYVEQYGYSSCDGSYPYAWSTPTTKNITLDVAKFRNAATQNGEYMEASATITSGGTATFWCNGTSGCGDMGWKNFNLSEGIVINFRVKGEIYDVATFDGNVTSATTDSWTQSGDTFTGTGLKGNYSLTVYYQLKRINAVPNKAVAPQYAYSPTGNVSSLATSDYPTSASYTASALSQSSTFTNVATKTYTVSVPIGTNSTYTTCFYMSYDDKIKFDTSGNIISEGRLFNGRKSACYHFKNPAKSYSASFSGATDVQMSGSQLQVTDNYSGTTKVGQTGVMMNYHREGDKTYIDNWPANANATATFTHNITFSSTNSAIPSWYTDKVSSGKVDSPWVVQESVDGGNSWSDMSGSGKAGTAQLSTGSLTVTTLTRAEDLGSSTAGKYVTYCQRLKYRPTTTYTTEANGDGYKIGTTYGDWTYGNSMCAIFRNPKWVEREDTSTQSSRVHTIQVNGETVATPQVTGAALENGVYDAKAVGITLLYNNTFWRNDTGYDETDTSTTFSPSKGSIYSSSAGNFNENFDVGVGNTGLTQLGVFYNGRVRYPSNTTANEELIPPLNSGSTDGYALRFRANGNKDTHSIWNTNGTRSQAQLNSWTSTFVAGSSELGGATKIALGVDPSATGDGKYVLMAGETKDLYVGTQNRQSEWTVQYVDIKRCETYEGQTDVCNYDRTELASTKPSPVLSGANAKEATSASMAHITLHRDYNFEVQSMTISEGVAGNEDVMTGDSAFSATFKIEVDREDKTKNYITDFQNPVFTKIVYVIPEGYIQANTDYIVGLTAGGGRTGAADTLCASEILPHLYPSGAAYARCISQAEDLSGRTTNYYTNKVYGSNTSSCVRDEGYCYDLYFNTSDTTFESLQIGDKVCVALAITPLSSAGADSGYFLSRSSCVNIGKKPMMEVLGASVMSASGVKGAVSVYNNSGVKTKYGSSVEFGIIGSGAVTNIASGLGFRGNGPTATGVDINAKICSLSLLTIANADCLEHTDKPTLGMANIAVDSTFPYKVASRYNSNEAIKTNEIDEHTFDAYGGNGNIYSDKPIVVYSTSDIRIKSNIIVKNGDYEDAKAPQIYIIAEQADTAHNAPNIYIDDAVTQIDAILVTTGYRGIGAGEVNTCAFESATGKTMVLQADLGEGVAIDPDTQAEISKDNCNQQLTINGGIISGAIKFRRTIGNGGMYDTSGSLLPEEQRMGYPAEVLNFRPSAYFSGYEQASGTSQPTVTYLRELAPRY